MSEEENRMPPEGWLNSVIGITIEHADEEKRKIAYPFELADTERLENIFDICTKMTAEKKTIGSRRAKAAKS